MFVSRVTSTTDVRPWRCASASTVCRMTLSADWDPNPTGSVRFPVGISTRNTPPLAVLTPRDRLPDSRSSSSFRDTVRALRPVSLRSFLKRSISSITVIGITSSCSSKTSSAFGSYRRTFVSRTKVRLGPAVCPSDWGTVMGLVAGCERRRSDRWEGDLFDAELERLLAPVRAVARAPGVRDLRVVEIHLAAFLAAGPDVEQEDAPRRLRGRQRGEGHRVDSPQEVRLQVEDDLRVAALVALDGNAVHEDLDLVVLRAVVLGHEPVLAGRDPFARLGRGGARALRVPDLDPIVRRFDPDVALGVDVDVDRLEVEVPERLGPHAVHVEGPSRGGLRQEERKHENDEGNHGFLPLLSHFAGRPSSGPLACGRLAPFLSPRLLAPLRAPAAVHDRAELLRDLEL